MTEEQELVLKVTGQLALNELNLKLREEAGLLAQSIIKLKEAGGANVQYEADIKRLSASCVTLNRELTNMNAQVGHFGSGAGLQASYILDDLVNSTGDWDRHLMSISNNIPGLALSFKGMGEWGDKIAASAGPIGLISTSIIAMAPLAKMAWAALTDAVPAEIMGELAERAKKVNSELEKLRASKTPEDVATQKGFEELFAGQAPDIESGIAGGLAESGSGAQMTPAEKARLERARQDMNLARNEGARQVAQEQLRNAQLQIQARISGSNDKTAGELFAQAPTNANVRQRIRDMATANPAGFPRGFASDMASMEPGASDEFDAAAAEFESGNEEWKRKKENAEKDRKAKKKADDKLAKQKTKQFADAIKADDDALDDADKAQREATREAATKKRAADALTRKNEAKARVDARLAERQAKAAPQQDMTDWFSNNTDANPAQAAELADRTLDLMRDTGIPMMQAAQIAYAQLSEKYMKLQQQLQAIQSGFMRANNRQLGGDNFSALSPMPGG